MAFSPMQTAHTPATLGQFLQHKAEHFPDTTVLRFVNASQADTVITYSSLLRQAHTLAVALHERGIRRGTPFGVIMQNHPEFIYALVAASLLGAILVPLDSRTQSATLCTQLAQTGCQALLAADYTLPQITSALSRLSEPPLVLVLHTTETLALPSCHYGPSLNAIAAAPDRFLSNPAANPEQPVEILYTSGTTGAPRGVLIDNRRLLEFRGLGKYIFGYRPDDRLYTGLPLAHGNAQAVTLMGALGQGIEAVFTQRFTKGRLWDMTRAYGITSFALLGGMATAIYSEPPRPDDADNPVRLVTSSGMPAALWEAFEQRFNVRILEWYGATEGGFVFKPAGEGPVGSFGRLSPGYEIDIVDAAGASCAPGVPGELCFRPTASPARLTSRRDPAATADRAPHGWVRSGDIVHRDTEGYLFFHHRQGAAIRRNGEFINPHEITRLLAEHPAVADVCVYGIPARSGAPGEQDIVAVVVPAERMQCPVTELFRACQSVLPANARPAYIHLASAIPRTLSEKPHTRLLQEQFDPANPEIFPAPPPLSL